MSNVELPISVTQADGAVVRCGASVDAWVDLIDATAKGIHMSRLYLALDEFAAAGTLTPESVRQLLCLFLSQHEDLSGSAHVSFRFDHMVRRPALVSGHQGWRSYPIEVEGHWDGAVLDLRVGFEVLYSSTCPCSAALARQLIQERFDHDFDPAVELSHETVRRWLGTPEAICATPHSQRSEAKVSVKLADGAQAFGLDALINQVEDALKTVVQTAVKREDEQAFALLNGRNLMFCEDAARRVQATLMSAPEVVDFRVECRHAESLHPHDAVAITTRGLPGGLRP